MISLLIMGWLLSSYISYLLYKSTIKQVAKEYRYYDKHGNLAASLFAGPLWLTINLCFYPYKSLHKDDIKTVAAFLLILIGSAVLVLLNVRL